MMMTIRVLLRKHFMILSLFFIFLFFIISPIEGQEIGTRENPVPLGQAAICDGWQIAVEKVYPMNNNIYAMIYLAHQDHRPLRDYEINRLKVIDHMGLIYDSNAYIEHSEITLRINASSSQGLLMYDNNSEQSERKYFALYYPPRR
jgi:hypothetical protein